MPRRHMGCSPRPRDKRASLRPPVAAKDFGELLRLGAVEVPVIVKLARPWRLDGGRCGAGQLPQQHRRRLAVLGPYPVVPGTSGGALTCGAAGYGNAMGTPQAAAYRHSAPVRQARSP